jgi:hypothetical protein
MSICAQLSTQGDLNEHTHVSEVQVIGRRSEKLGGVIEDPYIATLLGSEFCLCPRGTHTHTRSVHAAVYTHACPICAHTHTILFCATHSCIYTHTYTQGTPTRRGDYLTPFWLGRARAV